MGTLEVALIYAYIWCLKCALTWKKLGVFNGIPTLDQLQCPNMLTSEPTRMWAGHLLGSCSREQQIKLLTTEWLRSSGRWSTSLASTTTTLFTLVHICINKHWKKQKKGTIIESGGIAEVIGSNTVENTLKISGVHWNFPACVGIISSIHLSTTLQKYFFHSIYNLPQQLHRRFCFVFFFSQMDNHSQQENTTSSESLLSPFECITWITVFGIEAVAIVILNALTIIIYLKERSLRKRSMYLVINLAVSDMFVGGFVAIQCWFLGRDCDLWTTNSTGNPFYLVIIALLTVFPLASLTNLAAISLERTHATFRPFKHRTVKKKAFGAVIAAAWLTAALFATIRVLNVFHILHLDLNHGFPIPFVWFLLLSLLIITVSYLSIAIKIVGGNQSHRHGSISRETKLTRTLFLVTIVSLLLTLPHITLLIHSSLPSLNLSYILRQLNYFFYSLFFANSFINPVLYAFRIPEFRRALFSFLRRRFQPQPAQNFPLNNM